MESSLYLPRIFPKLIAFDLDGTLWYPEMYQLSGGSPFKEDSNNNLIDRKGKKVSLLGITDRILDDMKTLPVWKNTKIAWVSTCDEPSWAKECLKKFKTNPNKLLLENCSDTSQIYYANKSQHFKNIKKEFKDIPYEEMIFFDNQMNNISDVSPLGVHCVYSPDGMTKKVWETGLKSFENKKDEKL